MQLGITGDSYGSEQISWLGSEHGVENARSVTLDAAQIQDFKPTLKNGTHRTGQVPSGIPLKATSEGKYAPVTAAGDTLAGFLLTDQPFDGERDVIAPMIEHGKVRVGRLPKAAFDVTTLDSANPLFILETEA